MKKSIVASLLKSMIPMLTWNGFHGFLLVIWSMTMKGVKQVSLFARLDSADKRFRVSDSFIHQKYALLDCSMSKNAEKLNNSPEISENPLAWRSVHIWARWDYETVPS